MRIECACAKNLNINDHSFLSHIIVPFFNKLSFLTTSARRLVEAREKELVYKN